MLGRAIDCGEGPSAKAVALFIGERKVGEMIVRAFSKAERSAKERGNLLFREAIGQANRLARLRMTLVRRWRFVAGSVWCEGRSDDVLRELEYGKRQRKWNVRSDGLADDGACEWADISAGGFDSV